MKIIVKTSFIIILFTGTLLAHKEWVHQYIVREVYRYLELKLGMTYPDFKNHIGYNERLALTLSTMETCLSLELTEKMKKMIVAK